MSNEAQELKPVIKIGGFTQGQISREDSLGSLPGSIPARTRLTSEEAQRASFVRNEPASQHLEVDNLPDIKYARSLAEVDRSEVESIMQNLERIKRPRTPLSAPEQNILAKEGEAGLLVRGIPYLGKDEDGVPMRETVPEELFVLREASREERKKKEALISYRKNYLFDFKLLRFGPRINWVEIRSKNLEEIYEAKRHKVKYIITAAIVGMLKFGNPIAIISERRNEAYRETFRAKQITYMLDPAYNDGGKWVVQNFMDHLGNADPNNYNTWKGNKDLTNFAGGIDSFWQSFGDPKMRKAIIDQLPEGDSRRTLLEDLKDRVLTDQETEDWLVKRGIDPRAVYFIEQVSSEVKNGSGDVKGALDRIGSAGNFSK